MSYLPACKPEPKRGELGFPGECLQHGGSPHAGCCEYPKIPPEIADLPDPTPEELDDGSRMVNNLLEAGILIGLRAALKRLNHTFCFFDNGSAVWARAMIQENIRLRDANCCPICYLAEECACDRDDIDEVQERLR